ncbi:hypothetical protein MNBD_GAMMA11-2284 [hydrothermal vent metagenome]|uniref:Rap1a immunity protein domain-containing protein n=1 Tax=hydrothermal vent metagenome TaxID=652676 RepID=A0A3B0X875_9ZZZZ
MKKVVVLHIGILLSIFVQGVYSADERGRYWIYGVGRQVCETYMEARHEGGVSEISYKNWISGYLTSSNRSSEQTYNLLGATDFQGALIWVDSYCKKHPENTIYMAVANMTAVHYSKRQKSK